SVEPTIKISPGPSGSSAGRLSSVLSECGRKTGPAHSRPSKYIKFSNQQDPTGLWLSGAASRYARKTTPCQSDTRRGNPLDCIAGGYGVALRGRFFARSGSGRSIGSGGWATGALRRGDGFAAARPGGCSSGGASKASSSGSAVVR